MTTAEQIVYVFESIPAFWSSLIQFIGFLAALKLIFWMFDR